MFSYFLLKIREKDVVMLLLGEHDEPLQESDQKLAQIAANFLGSQMES